MAGPPLNHHRGGAGAPLVLIHGIGSSWQAFRPVLTALEGRHDVLALDLPGFGESAPLDPGTRPTIEALADAVEKAIGAAGFDRPHLAGNSLGGWIALELARRGRARTVVALSPGGMPNERERTFIVRSLEGTLAAAGALAPHADRLTRSAVVRTLLLGQVVGQPWRMSPEEAAGALRTLAASTAFRETLDWTLKRTNATGLEEIACPVRIAWGSQDRLLFPRQGPRFVRRIPGAEHFPMKGLGHVPMTDDPARVARAILDVTDGAAARSSAPA